MKRFSNSDQYLIVNGRTPIETQSTLQQADKAVLILNTHALKYNREPTYKHILNPRFNQAYNSNDYNPKFLFGEKS